MAHQPQPTANNVSAPWPERLSDAAKYKNQGFTVLQSTSTMPTRHEEQPEEAVVSKPYEPPNSNVAFWRDVHDAFDSIWATISLSKELRKSGVAKEWESILQRRVEWMKEDEEKLQAKYELREEWDVRVDDAEMKRTCRKQEDRLRRLRSKAIDEVAKRPAKAKEEYAGGWTYDKKTKETLRDVYAQCAKARKTFGRAVDEAVASKKCGARR